MLLECNNKLHGTVITVKSQYYSGLQVFVMKHFIWTLIYVPEAEKYFHFDIVIQVNYFLLSTQASSAMQTDNPSRNHKINA